MASERVAQEIGAMSDLELAVLLGMIAGQHILIRSGPVQTNLVGQEVELVRSSIIQTGDLPAKLV